MYTYCLQEVPGQVIGTVVTCNGVHCDNVGGGDVGCGGGDNKCMMGNIDNKLGGICNQHKEDYCPAHPMFLKNHDGCQIRTKCFLFANVGFIFSKKRPSRS